MKDLRYENSHIYYCMDVYCYFSPFVSAKRIQAKEATRRVAEDAQVIRRLRAVATYISCMDTAYVRENPENQLTPRKIAENKVQDSSTLGT